MTEAIQTFLMSEGNLHSHYGLELKVAPEVSRYLVRSLTQESGSAHIKKISKQVNACIEQRMLKSIDNHYPSNQLLLQLNETGQSLRCDWLQLLRTSV